MAYSLTYSYDSASQSYTVTGWSGITTSDKVVIQSTYDDGTNGSHPVTSIGNSAFSGCTNLTSVTIPDGVTRIENDAFTGCTNLTNVTIPNSVTSFGDYIFNDCANLQYNVKDNLKYLGNSENPYIYLGNNSETDITTADIDSHCRFISSYAFSGCNNLTSVNIPDGVTRIGSYAFRYCNNLMSAIIPDSVTSIGNYAFLECTSLKSLKLGNGLTSVGFYAFNKCISLTNVEIPKSLKVITNGMFHSCSNLTSVIIPEGVESIELNTFAYCEKLTCVVIPESVTGIGKNAFENCTNLNSIIIFNTTPPTLGSWAIPNNVQFIYVLQSSKEAYKGHTNWNTFADKIVSDNVYLSFVRFNQKNKEYIGEKINESWDDFNIENGEGADSLVQKYIVNEIDYSAKASGINSIALGGKRIDKLSDETRTPTSAEGNQSFAAGGSTHAYGDWSSAFGKDGNSYQRCSSAFGGGTQAGLSYEEWLESNPDGTKEQYDESYSFAFAQGESTKATGRGAHSEGRDTTASGTGSHAEGGRTIASAENAHAEGGNTKALYPNSHAEGYQTKTSKNDQHVCGRYNKENTEAMMIVGNGTSESDRKNAFEVLFDGRAKVQSAPVDDDDVVRKADLSNVGGGKLYLHAVIVSDGRDLSGISLFFYTYSNIAFTPSTFKEYFRNYYRYLGITGKGNHENNRYTSYAFVNTSDPSHENDVITYYKIIDGIGSETTLELSEFNDSYGQFYDIVTEL